MPADKPIEGKLGRGLVRPLSFIGGIALAAGLASAPAAASELPPPRGGPIYEAIVLDAETGQVLRELNPDAVTYPASLTKMMTLYLTFEALNSGRLRLDQYFQVSAAAAAHSPSKLGLEPGESVSVRDLILGIVTKSANDAAATLAEGLGGSEVNFAAMMTQKARQLGMAHTVYHNASGLPDPGQLTTARDIARLALALLHDFPREYRYFSVRQFEFEGRIVDSHDHLLEWYDGADGIKTGYTVASGFNLATSAVRNGHRLIGVIMGGSNARVRDEEMARLLDLGFADLGNQAPVVAQNHPPAAPLIAAAPAQPPAQVAAAQPAKSQPSFAALAGASLAAPAAANPAPVAPPAAASPQPEPHPSTIGSVAAAAIQHLAPVSHAEAATVQPEASEAWGIQVGTYRGEAAAERAEHKISRLAVAKGKDSVILAPAAGEHDRIYRLRLLHFSPNGARNACDELHRQGIACTIVPPAGMKVASR
ncbi:MAG TPA: D-alanyl-D-alanine carboxypeptidase [Stellaceae bacterium]|nr:D-alanyl-D-alanine carboxypeptidase [Stellaceae bacterium]